MAAHQQDEARAIKPMPRCPLIAAEQIGRGPAELECRVQPSACDQLMRIALDLQPAIGRHAERAFSCEDDPNALADFSRQARVDLVICGVDRRRRLDRLSADNRATISGLCCRSRARR
jgi:hypothetical protein